MNVKGAKGDRTQEASSRLAYHDVNFGIPLLDDKRATQADGLEKGRASTKVERTLLQIESKSRLRCFATHCLTPTSIYLIAILGTERLADCGDQVAVTLARGRLDTEHLVVGAWRAVT